MSPPPPKFSQLKFTDRLGNVVDPSRYAGPVTLTFETQSVSVAVLNSLRRVIKAQVETVSIDRDSIKIHTNVSPLNNDIIKDRFKQVPVHLTAAELSQWNEAGPYRFRLKVQNTTSETIAVTSKSIQVESVGNRAMVPESVRDKLFPPNPLSGGHVVLLYLRPAAVSTQIEEIELEFLARKGAGSSLHDPTSKCFFKYKMDAELVEEMFAEEQKSDPGLTRDQFIVSKGMRCWKKDELGDPESLVGEICCETILNPTYLVTTAFDILIRKVSDLPVRMDQVNGFDIRKLEKSEASYEITLRKETHTLGNLLQSLLYKHWRSGDRVVAIGYFQPHPSEDVIVLKMELASQTEDVATVLRDGIEWVRQHLEELRAAWIAELS